MNILLLIHVLISLAALATGFVVLGGWLSGRHLRGWTGLYLLTITATSLSGFLLPLPSGSPAVPLAILSLILLAVALTALLAGKLAGRWQATYVVTALAALYFDFFVLIAQLFQKVPALKELAPAQAEAPFLVSQLLGLCLFIAFGVGALRQLKRAAAAK